MLTTTRREIINDYDITQNRQLRNFSEGQMATTTNFRDRFSSQSDVSSETYLSRSELAQKLCGPSYNEEYDIMDNANEDFTDPDLMPSVTTMQITRSPYYQQPAKAQQKEVTKQRYTARSKILIASYAAVVLALALIITLTTISVASLFSQVSALEATLNTEKAVVATLDEDIEAAGSADAVIEKAQEMGMTAGVISGSVALPETKAPVEANVSTNWFDSLCDTLSKLFG